MIRNGLLSLLVASALCIGQPALATASGNGVADGTATVTNMRYEDAFYGAESNPTGSPIGGGSGYVQIFTTGDYVVSTASELINALRMASAGDVVYVAPDSVIDMTGRMGVVVPLGVTLAGNRGSNGSAGPLIFTDVFDTTPLFVLDGARARFTGLRLQGPDGIVGESYDFRPTSLAISARGARSEVDNCEIYNWSYGGVKAEATDSYIYIHHNYIHHVQRTGYGYPVVVTNGKALIEANIFDWYRHAIAGSGYRGVGYEARYNIVGAHATSHAFDMHGGGDYCPKIGCATEDQFIAGEFVHIHHNTFGATGNSSIVLRGVPTGRTEVYNNWFTLGANTTEGFKHTRNEGGNVTVRNNAYGAARVIIAEHISPESAVRKCSGACKGDGIVVGQVDNSSINFVMPLLDGAMPIPGIDFGFLTPAKNTAVTGLFPVTLYLSLGDAFTLGQVEINLDSKTVWRDTQAPGAGELLIDSKTLDDGAHVLEMIITNTANSSLKHIISFKVDNFWEKIEQFPEPKVSGWFGMVDLSLTSDASAGWAYSTDTDVTAFDDPDRRMRITNMPEYLVWDMPSLVEYTAVIYVQTPDVLNGLHMAVAAADGKWTPSAWQLQSSQLLVNGWQRVELKGVIPADVVVARIRLDVDETVAANTLQLGSIMFSGRQLAAN